MGVWGNVPAIPASPALLKNNPVNPVNPVENKNERANDIGYGKTKMRQPDLG